MSQITQAKRVLEELVAARDKEIALLQKRQAEQLKKIEEKGRKQLDGLTTMMGVENTELFSKLKDNYSSTAKSIDTELESVKAKLTAIDPVEVANKTPSLDFGIVPLATTALTPYYAKVYGSDGSVYWQGYNPGNLDVNTWASGSGTGLFGTGAGSFTAYIDWWFVFRPDSNRFYAFDNYIPYHGFYIVRSDDGVFTSKEAKVRIDVSAVAYQYNYKPSASTNVLDVGSDNIDVNDRFDGWRHTYYSTLLGGGDSAYLRLTSSYYVYARGGGSYAQLNFADGAANYMGVPVVYVS